MKITIEVEWFPNTTLGENPDDDFRFAMDKAQFTAVRMCDELEGYKGSAKITDVHVRRD